MDITRTAGINQLLVTVGKNADLNEFIFCWNSIYFYKGPVHMLKTCASEKKRKKKEGRKISR